jgi:hypothetical protein
VVKDAAEDGKRPAPLRDELDFAGLPDIQRHPFALLADSLAGVAADHLKCSFTVD